jgi:hypothetical protein
MTYKKFYCRSIVYVLWEYPVSVGAWGFRKDWISFSDGAIWTGLTVFCFPLTLPLTD